MKPYLDPGRTAHESRDCTDWLPGEELGGKRHTGERDRLSHGRGQPERMVLR